MEAAVVLFHNPVVAGKNPANVGAVSAGGAILSGIKTEVSKIKTEIVNVLPHIHKNEHHKEIGKEQGKEPHKEQVKEKNKETTVPSVVKENPEKTHKPFSAVLPSIVKPSTVQIPKLPVRESHHRKIDPKVATKQNVSDLKNALAAVLKKGDAKVAEAVPVKTAETTEPVKVDNKIDTNAGKKPDEVPEDVLKKVLDVN